MNKLKFPTIPQERGDQMGVPLGAYLSRFRGAQREGREEILQKLRELANVGVAAAQAANQRQQTELQARKIGMDEALVSGKLETQQLEIDTLKEQLLDLQQFRKFRTELQPGKVQEQDAAGSIADVKATHYPAIARDETTQSEFGVTEKRTELSDAARERERAEVARRDLIQETGVPPETQALLTEFYKQEAEAFTAKAATNFNLAFKEAQANAAELDIRIALAEHQRTPENIAKLKKFAMDRQQQQSDLTHSEIQKNLAAAGQSVETMSEKDMVAIIQKAGSLITQLLAGVPINEAVDNLGPPGATVVFNYLRTENIDEALVETKKILHYMKHRLMRVHQQNYDAITKMDKDGKFVFEIIPKEGIEGREYRQGMTMPMNWLNETGTPAPAQQPAPDIPEVIGTTRGIGGTPAVPGGTQPASGIDSGVIDWNRIGERAAGMRATP